MIGPIGRAKGRREAADLRADVRGPPRGRPVRETTWDRGAARWARDGGGRLLERMVRREGDTRRAAAGCLKSGGDGRSQWRAEQSVARSRNVTGSRVAAKVRVGGMEGGPQKKRNTRWVWELSWESGTTGEK